MADAPKAPGGELKSPGIGLGKDKDLGDEVKPKKLVPKPPPVSGRSLAIGLIVAAGLISSAWVVNTRFGERYQLVPVHQQENTFMFRIDTFTGTVHFCTTQQCSELPIR